MRIWKLFHALFYSRTVLVGLVLATVFLSGIGFSRMQTFRSVQAKPPSLSSTPRANHLTPDFGPIQKLMLGAGPLVMKHPSVFAEVVRGLHERVELVGLISSEAERSRCVSVLAKNGLSADVMQFMVVPLDTIWVRDYGPLFVEDIHGEVFMVDGDYSKIDTIERWRDDEFPILLSNWLGLPLRSVPFRLEGGNLLTNGKGLVVTTTRLIARNTSRGYSMQQILQFMDDNLGAKSWLYLKELRGEPTGHVDMFATFLRENVAVVGAYDPADDPVNAKILDEAAARLSDLQTEQGPVQVHRVPMPPRHDGRWRSYCNVVMANGVLVVPTYASVDPELERRALDVYRRLLPEVRMVTVPADELASTAGLLRCFTLPVPSFVDTTQMATWLKRQGG